MSGATKLSTKAGIATGRVGAQDDSVRHTGDSVHFTAKPRRPETMDHINARDRDFHGLPGRNIKSIDD